MFLQNLTNDEIKSIIEMTICVAKTTDKVKIQEMLKDCQITNSSGDVIRVIFAGEWEDEWLHIYDFEIRSSFIYTKTDSKQINVQFQKSMYKKCNIIC